MTRFGYVDHHWVAIFVLRHIRRDRIEGRYRKRSWRHFTGTTQIQAIERAVEPVRRGFVQGALRSGRATDEETGRRVGDYGLLQLLSRDSQRLGVEEVVVGVTRGGVCSPRKTRWTEPRGDLSLGRFRTQHCAGASRGKCHRRAE